MTLTQLKTTIYTLLQPILGETVIWADQSAPRPALPYTTIKFGVINKVGRSYYSNVDNVGVQSVFSVLESVLNVQRFGADSVSALQTFTEKMQLSTNIEKLSVQDISLFDISPVTDIAELLNGISIEPRASVDLYFRWTSKQTDAVGIIEFVDINGDVGPDSTALNEKYTINISMN